MSLVISRMSDFIAFSLYFIGGFQDIFLQPHLAVHSGLALFFFTYTVILLLLGIPAYAEESSSSMTDKESVVDKRRSADISYPHSWAHSLIALMQNLQRTIAMSCDLLEVAVAQTFITYIDETVRPALASIPVDQMCSNSTSGGGSRSMCKLTRLICDYQTMASITYNKLYYATVILTIIVFVYSATFGRALRTYCVISRFYLAVMALFGMVQMLLFLGVNVNQDVGKLQQGSVNTTRHNDEALIQTLVWLIPNTLDNCLLSLGLSTFGIAVLGNRAGRKIKQSFVTLTFVVCLGDLGISFGFAFVNFLREWMIFSRCDISEHYESIKQFHEFGGLTRAEGFTNRLRNTILSSVESVMLFHETSGHIPWTVYVPMQILLYVFFLLRISSYFVLTDLQAFISFNNRTYCILLTSVLRMAMLICLTLLLINGNWAIVVSYMKASANISFLIIKLIECINIKRYEGFDEYFRRKRSLLPEDSCVQMFIYNWFIVPSIWYLFHLGYLLILLIYLILYYDLVFNWQFGVYYCFFNVIPIGLIVILANIKDKV